MNIFKWMKKNKDILENPWDKYYEKDKRTIEVPDCSIYHYFERARYSCFKLFWDKNYV